MNGPPDPPRPQASSASAPNAKAPRASSLPATPPTRADNVRPQNCPSPEPRRRQLWLVCWPHRRGIALRIGAAPLRGETLPSASILIARPARARGQCRERVLIDMNSRLTDGPCSTPAKARTNAISPARSSPYSPSAAKMQKGGATASHPGSSAIATPTARGGGSRPTRSRIRRARVSRAQCGAMQGRRSPRRRYRPRRLRSLNTSGGLAFLLCAILLISTSVT